MSEVDKSKIVSETAKLVGCSWEGVVNTCREWGERVLETTRGRVHYRILTIQDQETEAAEAPAEEEETGGAAGEEERTPGCTVGKQGGGGRRGAQHAADMKTQRGPAPVLCSPCFIIIIIIINV